MRALGVLVIVVALAVVPAAQQKVLSSRTVLVTVAADNRALVDLGIDDFVVDEGGAAREVIDVHIADYPVAMLLDSAVPPEDFAAIRDAAARFVGRIGERAVAIGTLASAAMVTTFEDDRAKALATIRELVPSHGDRPMPLEALTSAINLVLQTEAAFSAVVVVSANSIGPDPSESLSLLKPLLDSRIPIHVVALRASSGVGPSETGNDLLREVSNLTRGQYMTIYSPASYGVALDRFADRLASEMMIQFLVPSGSAGGNLRVGVRVPGARVTGLGVSR